ncbi:MAG: hypothetical protein ABIG30_00845 [Candidatus Aenigmatarchaeota archaeon]
MMREKAAERKRIRRMNPEERQQYIQQQRRNREPDSDMTDDRSNEPTLGFVRRSLGFGGGCGYISSFAQAPYPEPFVRDIYHNF